MKKYARLLCLIMALTMTVFMAACSGGAASSAAASTAPASTAPASEAAEFTGGAAGGSTFTIGLSTKTITNNEFIRVLVESAQKTVEDAGHTFELVLAGGELEVAAQVNNIEDLINKGVDGMIVIPMDGQAVIPALEKAKDAGIPVVLADVGLEEGHEDLYVTLVGTDNYAVGMKAAEEMIAAVGEGEVIMVRGASGAMGGELRASGFRDGLEGSSVTIANEQSGDWLSEVAMQVTENMLQSNPETKGVFLASDAMLPGVISAVENAGKIGEITIISVDGNLSAVDEIEAGNCYGTVGQRPAEIGQQAAEILMGVLDGSTSADSVEKFIDSGYIFMSEANLDEARASAF